jgi:hypothetical protein
MVKLWKNLPGDGGEVERDVLGARVARWKTGLRRVREIAVRCGCQGEIGWVRCQHLHVVKRLKPDDVRHPECRVRERKGARFRLSADEQRCAVFAW